MDFGVDWSELPTDLLGCVAGCLTLIEDFMAFRGVCTSWRSAATNDKFVSVSKAPLLMLSEKDGSNIREYYSLSKRKICMRKPLFGARGKKCADVGFGWILTVADSGKVCLLKPLSFASPRIQLPNFKTFPGYRKSNPKTSFITRALLTANPSDTSNFMLLMVTPISVGSLGFWRNGDQNWTAIRNPGAEHMVYRNGKLYVMNMGYEEDHPCNVEIWDLHADLSKPQKIVKLIAKVINAPTYHFSLWDHYMVESTDGELLLVTRNNTDIDDYIDTGADFFFVMRVDLVKGELIGVRNLGKDAIFLGDNAAVSVDATEFPGVLKPNCIYFTDDRILQYYFQDRGWDKGGGKDMGIYNVEEESIERFEVESFGRLCSPLWIFPSF